MQLAVFFAAPPPLTSMKSMESLKSSEVSVAGYGLQPPLTVVVGAGLTEASPRVTSIVSQW